MLFNITLRSGNMKTGPIPVTMSAKQTCPTTCPLMKNGCYAETSQLGIHWARLSKGDWGVTFNELCKRIASLAPGTLWRHNQAGDLPGVGTHLAIGMLKDLVEANRGKRGFTYTHKPLYKQEERAAVKDAIRQGFTINLSANNLKEADYWAAQGFPTVAVVPHDHPKLSKTPKGRRVVVCPAQDRDDVTCESCKLCQVANRPCIVAFRAHGARFKRVDEMTKKGSQ